MALNYLTLATFAVLGTTIPPSTASPVPAWIRSVARGQAGATPAAADDFIAAQLRGAGAGGRARRAKACDDAKAWSDAMDAACPKQCDTDGDESANLAKCDDGQEERTPSSCGTQTCAGYLSTIDVAKLESVRDGYAQCDEEGEDGFVKGLLGGGGGAKMLQVITEDIARSCGKLSAVDLPPRPAGASCVDSMSFSKLLDTQCPKQCEKKDDRRRDENAELPTCVGGQPERSREKCGTDSCSALFAGVSANRVAQLEAGFQQCLVEGESLGERALEAFFSSLIFGANPGFLGMMLTGVASDCGQTFEVGGNSCMSAYSRIGQMDQKCPKKCSKEEKEKDRNGLPLCADDRERDFESCGDTECGDFLATFDQARIDSMITAFGSCTGPYAQIGEQFTEDTVKFAVNTLATQCGHRNRLNIRMSGCLGFVDQISQFDSKCPKQCRNEDEDEDIGLPICTEGQPQHTRSTCGSKACSDHLTKIMSKESQCWAKSCDGPYAVYGQHALQDSHAASIAYSCGIWEDVDVEWSPATRSCIEAQSWGAKLESACPQTCCGDDDDDCQLRKCDDDESEYSISGCGIASCSSYLSEVTADDIGALVCGFGACSSDLTSDSNSPSVQEIHGHLRRMAAQCGFPNEYTVDLTDLSGECPEVSEPVPVECGNDANVDAPIQTTTVSNSTTSTIGAETDAATRYSVQSTVALLAVTACVVAAVL